MPSESSIAADFETPIPKIIGGETIEFPRLMMPDIVKWASEIQNKRISDARKRHQDAKLSKYESEQLIQEIADKDVELGAVMIKSFTPAGITKTLALSLKRLGKTDEESLSIINRIHFREQHELAMLILSAPAPREAKPEESGDGSANPPQGDEPITD